MSKHPRCLGYHVLQAWRFCMWKAYRRYLTAFKLSRKLQIEIIRYVRHVPHLKWSDEVSWHRVISVLFDEPVTSPFLFYDEQILRDEISAVFMYFRSRLKGKWNADESEQRSSKDRKESHIWLGLSYHCLYFYFVPAMCEKLCDFHALSLLIWVWK